MFYCDVCNAPLDFRQGFTVSSADFNKLLDADFGIDEYNTKMLTDTGMKGIAGVEQYFEKYLTDIHSTDLQLSVDLRVQYVLKSGFRGLYRR